MEDIKSVIPLSNIVSDHKGQVLEINRRPLSSVHGYVLLHAKRLNTIILQPSKEVFSRWNEMTEGKQAGLDWSNVFVAGGMILSALITQGG